MTHIMIDLETLGTRPGCQLLSIGAVAFSTFGLGEEFYVVLDPEDQEQYGLRADPETVRWWSEQSVEARAAVFGEGVQKLSLSSGLRGFANWLAGCGPKKERRIWGNGAAFDNVLLAEAFSAARLSLPWEFFGDRCYRTVKRLRDPHHALLSLFEGTPHHALHDAKHQARHLIAMVNAHGTISLD